MAGKNELIFDITDLPGVKNIIVVASGKGGEGKSTVAANLADKFNTSLLGQIPLIRDIGKYSGTPE